MFIGRVGTCASRFRFSVDENGSPVPLRSPLTQNRRRVGARMTVVDQIRVVLDSDNESGDEEEEDGGMIMILGNIDAGP